MKNQASFSPKSFRGPNSYPQTCPKTSGDTTRGIVPVWFVALMVGELALPLTFDFSDAADAYRALRQVRARYPLATVRRSAAARLALFNDWEYDHG